MRIGLFFGSFNPIHIGHLIIANFMATQTDLERVWFVVSPQNPLKPKKTLARDHDRLHLVRLGIGENPMLRASDIEFQLPKPSYTIDTLAFLKEKYPEHQFVLIMGADNIGSLHLEKLRANPCRIRHLRVQTPRLRILANSPQIQGCAFSSLPPLTFLPLISANASKPENPCATLCLRRFGNISSRVVCIVSLKGRVV